MSFELHVFQCTKYGYYHKIKINFFASLVPSLEHWKKYDLNMI